MKQCTNCREVKHASEFSKHVRGGLQSWCKDCQAWAVNRRIISLDMQSQYTGRALHGVVEARPLRTTTDPTWEKVGLAFAYMIRTKVITPAQVEAIYMHDIEGLSLGEIADLCGCSKSNVHETYRSGITRLRKRYDDNFIESDSETSQNERRGVTEGVGV